MCCMLNFVGHCSVIFQSLYPSLLHGIMVVPLQEGVNRIGTWFTDKEELMKSVKKLKSENKKLNEKVDELTEENSLLAQNKYKLDRLEELYNLDNEYSKYKSGCFCYWKRDR